MPLIQSTGSLAAGAVVDNVLQGSQFEFLPYNAALSFAVNGDAGGGDLRIDVYSGQDVLAESMTGNTVNRFPVNPDDFLLQDVAGAGERIKVRIRNVGATSRSYYFAVIITPV